MMKVKANYSISCEKGSFRTGEIFEIEACDLSLYGDAVAVVEDVPAAPAVPEAEENVQEEPVEEAPAAEEPVAEKPVAEEPAAEKPAAEKPKASTSASRRRKVSETAK